ncbi:MAG TPA: hypothetical protein VEY91_00585, partial [Candidatus Limnocylindria bacterium]|nr:hypothetical protein [Candidatus Limnocylindria bacterium]
GLVGWVDRLGGLFAGAALGLAIVAFVLLAALSLRLPRPIAAGAGGARVTVPLMRGGATACRICAPYFPGTTWLRRRFLAAELRAGRLAADANSTKKI